MGYKKDQGRFARMTAFWALFLLLAYGCLGGLVYQLRSWFGRDPTAPPGEWSFETVMIEQFPLLGDVDVAMVVTLAFLAVFGVILYRMLNRPRAADLLIDTETELRKVTWPSWGDTWTGTLAVALTVTCLLAYLWCCDLVLSVVLTRAMGAGG